MDANRVPRFGRKIVRNQEYRIEEIPELPRHTHEEYMSYKAAFIDQWVTEQVAYTKMINNKSKQELSLDDYIMRSQQGLPVSTATSFANYDGTENHQDLKMGKPRSDSIQINELSIQVQQMPIPNKTNEVCNSESDPKNLNDNKKDKKSGSQDKKKKTRKETNSKRVKIS